MTRVAAVIAVFALALSASAQVTLRDGRAHPGAVISVDSSGVTAVGAEGVITWDRVLRVSGEHADAAAAFSQLAEDLWRARTRLARGDVRLARPIFEAWFTHDEAPTGATALVVAEGLLRCRLADGAQTAAVEPWIAALRLHAAGARADLGFTSAIDAATGLAPTLAPIWLPGAAVETFARASIELIETSQDAATDDRAASLATLFRIAASIETGSPQPLPPSRADPSDAERLVRDIIESRSPEPAIRDAARARLRDGIDREPGDWRECWRRVALGRSLLMEDSPDARDLGVAHLLHAPARFARDLPRLASVALTIAADEFERRGDPDAARRLRDERSLLEPGSPHTATSPAPATALASRTHKETQ